MSELGSGPASQRPGAEVGPAGSTSRSEGRALSSSGAGRAIFRVSPLVIFFALALAFCATPVAFAAPFLWLLYLVPLGIIAWTLRTRTVGDAEGLRVRRLVGSRRLAWDDITALRLDDRGRVRAVRAAGGELVLPAVHVRDVHVLAAASGGRVPDPGGG